MILAVYVPFEEGILFHLCGAPDLKFQVVGARWAGIPWGALFSRFMEFTGKGEAGAITLFPRFGDTVQPFNFLV